MSSRQWKRWDAVERVRVGLMTNAEAALALGLSARQMRRLRARVAKLGPKGVVHGNRGRGAGASSGGAGSGRGGGAALG